MLKMACVLLALYFAGLCSAYAIETKAKHAFMMDFDTKEVLLNKSGDELMHPSSMSKLMTTYVLYQRLREGRVHLDDMLTVSEKAWRMEGSKMFVKVGDQVKLEDLIRGIVIQSGNDACVTIAENISGSEEAFAQEMTRVGKEIGLQNSHFANATGWPDENHKMTARDLATLAYHIITDFPEDYKYYSEKEFVYNNIHQPNRNRLLGSSIGVDGLKTGHTEVGGYGITLSAKDPKTGRRLILVINGLESDNERVEEGDKLLRWGFREFENIKLSKQGEVVDRVPVWLGAAPDVAVAPQKDVMVTIAANDRKNINFTLVYNAPAPAPVEPGTHVADLVIKMPQRETVVVPLVTVERVERLGAFGRLLATVEHTVFGKNK